MKTVFLFTFVFILFISYGQENNFKFNTKIIIVDIVESNDMVLVYPFQHNPDNNKEMVCFVTKKNNIQIKLDNDKKNIKYTVLDSDCFDLFYNSGAIYDFILPLLSDSLKLILMKSYDNPYNFINLSLGESIVYNKNVIRNINHNKFLLVLMQVELFNEISSHICPLKLRFKNEKTMNGLYVKLLIPLISE